MILLKYFLKIIKLLHFHFLNVHEFNIGTIFASFEKFVKTIIFNVLYTFERIFEIKIKVIA